LTDRLPLSLHVAEAIGLWFGTDPPITVTPLHRARVRPSEQYDAPTEARFRLA
jgi:hypothetical protein